MSISANDPSLKSWVEIAPNSDFPIQNLPFGIFRKEGQAPRVCSAIGDYVIDLLAVAEHGFFDDFTFDKKAAFENQYLNDFIALGKPITNEIRNRLAAILDTDHDEWDAKELQEFILVPMSEVELLLPIRVGDYTDFYSSIEHATNIGSLFRDPENALLPNWRHLPVGYHGRASSIMVSGTDIKRPCGQQKPADAPPVYGPCKLLDFELEMGFVIGKQTDLGDAVSTANAEDHIFGLILFNDWSARDIQKWEYVPLGPFLGKNFASTVSPWIVTLEALEPFRQQGPTQDPEVLPYLQYEGKKNYDVNLEVAIKPENGAEKVVCNSNFKYMYWNMCQQLAHHTVNGCNIKVGDMCASGTISGPERGSYGSMLEISWKGTKPVDMPDGSQRKFIDDGDTVIMRGWCEKDGVRIGFGEANGKILPATPIL